MNHSFFECLNIIAQFKRFVKGFCQFLICEGILLSLFVGQADAVGDHRNELTVGGLTAL